MSDELKPCPFCGGEKIRDRFIRDGRQVYCADCSASVTAFQPNATENARSLWNGRTDAAELEQAADVIADRNAEISDLRRKLFPYADAAEISGISWDGKYLIGDKASIRFFHEMKNRGEQIDVYKRAYDQNLAAKDAVIERLREALTVLEKAATEFHDAATEYLSDSTYDADGVLANAEAQLSVTAIPEARSALSKQESTNA